MKTGLRISMLFAAHAALLFVPSHLAAEEPLPTSAAETALADDPEALEIPGTPTDASALDETAAPPDDATATAGDAAEGDSVPAETRPTETQSNEAQAAKTEPAEAVAAPNTETVADAAPLPPEPPIETTADATADPVPPTPPAPPAPPKPAKKPVLVPGTGVLVKGVGDDFEDENWKWYYNHPKSSEEQDKRLRSPLGKSANGRWFEGPMRGTPDVVKRIPLPAPGLEGSAHGLLISTLNAGIPGRVTYALQQDDLIYNMQRVTGRGIAVADSPSVVVRVYMPPLEQWEQRTGPTFGFRAGCYTHAIITGKDHPDRGKFGLEEYWPGMFVCLEKGGRRRDGTVVEDTAFLRIRGSSRGTEIRGPAIGQFGWWTLGLSFSPDGMVHYFARPGVDELTMDDHITSQFPYGYRTEWLKTFFFNVCNRDDGRTWSTPWVIDDPKVSFVKRPQVATPSRTRMKR
jgi:hypothetical protein